MYDIIVKQDEKKFCINQKTSKGHQWVASHKLRNTGLKDQNVGPCVLLTFSKILIKIWVKFDPIRIFCNYVKPIITLYF